MIKIEINMTKYIEIDDKQFKTAQGLQNYYIENKQFKKGQWKIKIVDKNGNEYKEMIENDIEFDNIFDLLFFHIQEKRNVNQASDLEKELLALQIFEISDYLINRNQDEISFINEGYIPDQEECFKLAEQCAIYDIENNLDEGQGLEKLTEEYMNLETNVLLYNFDLKYERNYEEEQIRILQGNTKLPQSSYERINYYANPHRKIPRDIKKKEKTYTRILSKIDPED